MREKKTRINIGVIGFGTVGSGTVKVLWEQKAEIEKALGVNVEVVKIVDKDWVRARSIVIPPSLRGEDPAEVLNDDSIDVVVEAIGGLEPAFTIVKEALERGKTVVTPNKELVAKKGEELLQVALKSGSELFFEGSVGGGIPIIHVLKEQLLGDDIEEIFGIVNGTTNFILSEMSLKGVSYQEALQEAQKLGYAEPVPTMDVEGFDAAYKIAILASLAFRTRVDVDRVYREGITALLPQDIDFARELGYVIKLLAIAKKDKNQLELRVHPVLLPSWHSLASVNGVENAIFVKSRTRNLTFIGPGAGGEATGSAIVGDIIEAIRNLKYSCRGRAGYNCINNFPVKPMEEVVDQYCVRILAYDRPGVLGKIATEFGTCGVSLSAVKQPISVPSQLTYIYFLTHHTQESQLQLALEHIRKLSVVSDAFAIRVESGS